ncbi:hypothetical protein AJ87_19785 [Rhizobium yanglingense]|nr:hypothetical protein AJ87_19785 [Rhizobium yanglingense]
MSGADLAALDKNEGYRSDRDPTANAYNRLTVIINLNGEQLEMETYVASPQEGSHLPNSAYLKHLRDGASHHGLPGAYQSFLTDLPDDQSTQ